MSEKKSMMAIAINKSLCKECSVKDSNTTTWSRVVYLENGTEFQIQLFNPHKFTIGAEIYINDEKLSNRLVLKPGERVWLERYLDVKKKFKFSTYEVEGNDPMVQEAIKDNGKIEVKFYREVRIKNYSSYPTISLDGNGWWKNYDKNNNKYPETIDVLYKNTSDNANKFETTHCYSSKLCGQGVYGDVSTSTITATSYCADTTINYSVDTTANYCATVDLNACYPETSAATSISMPNKMICETGRIETGSTSKQEFDNVNIDFEYFPFVTEKIKLLPMSQKPVFANDLQKVYCPECGRKLKTKYKFCPYCGTEVE